MNLADVFIALWAAGVLVIAGKVIRGKVGVLQSLFIPSSIIAGILALCLGPQVLGNLMQATGGDGARFADGVWPEQVQSIWSAFPSMLITVVFAGLFLGKTLPDIKSIWAQSGPMIVHGQTLAWGQYVVGITLALLLLTPVFGISPLAGALLEISFEGGHGTAAGLGNTFRELGFEDGADLALGLATIGVVMGVILGTILVNWAVRTGRLEPPTDEPNMLAAGSNEILDDRNGEEERPRDSSIEPLSIHLGLFGLAIGAGWLLWRGMIWVEAEWLMPMGWPELLRHIPLFPLAMIGGVLVQMVAEKTGFARLIDRDLVNRVSGTALDFLIVAAVGTLSLAAIGTHVWVFVLIALAGIAWNLFGFLVLAPLLFPKYWVTYGLANFGQGMGMTVIGLLLVRMTDPHNKTRAMEAFGYKQLLFEPVVGGGLFTAASLPLLAQFGAGPVLIGVTAVMLAWFLFGMVAFGPWGKSKRVL